MENLQTIGGTEEMILEVSTGGDEVCAAAREFVNWCVRPRDLFLPL